MEFICNKYLEDLPGEIIKRISNAFSGEILQEIFRQFDRDCPRNFQKFCERFSMGISGRTQWKQVKEFLKKVLKSTNINNEKIPVGILRGIFSKHMIE